MIKHLEIKDFALLHNLEIDFTDGLNVFTGETGSGKSLVFSALNYVLGSGNQTGDVAAVFSPDEESIRFLQQNEFEIEDEILISRKTKPGGGNVCRVNGTPVPLSKLKMLAPFLLEINGQHSHYSLTQFKTALLFLDAFGKINSKKFASQFLEWEKLKNEIQQLDDQAQNRERELDLCRYELNEIQSAKLAEDEEAALELEKEKLSKLQKLEQTLEEAITTFEHTPISKLRTQLELLSPFEKELQEWLPKFQEIEYDWLEIARTLKASRENFSADPGRLDEVIERLDRIERLKKKYGVSIPEILAYAKERKAKLDRVMNLGNSLSDLQKKLAEIETALKKESEILSSWRRKTAEQLSSEMEIELKRLGIPHGKFLVSVEDLDHWISSGQNKVSFLVSFNAGEKPMPLAKVASGGELSRIMLSLQGLFTGSSNAVIAFDEVDAGLGGEVAFHVAERLQRLAKKKQVLCVTHLHQVASLADSHFQLSKKTVDGRTLIAVNSLNQEERILELARMMAGARQSSTVLKHAEELLSQSKSKKT